MNYNVRIKNQSRIKQLSSVELANYEIFLLEEKKYFIKVWFTEIKAWSSSGLFWLS